MTLNSNLKNLILIIFATLILSACSTAKKSADIEGDVYTGKETVEYLASGVPDRVFFCYKQIIFDYSFKSYIKKASYFFKKK